MLSVGFLDPWLRWLASDRHFGWTVATSDSRGPWRPRLSLGTIIQCAFVASRSTLPFSTRRHKWKNYYTWPCFRGSPETWWASSQTPLLVRGARRFQRWLPCPWGAVWVAFRSLPRPLVSSRILRSIDGLWAFWLSTFECILACLKGTLFYRRAWWLHKVPPFFSTIWASVKKRTNLLAGRRIVVVSRYCDFFRPCASCAHSHSPDLLSASRIWLGPLLRDPPTGGRRSWSWTPFPYPQLRTSSLGQSVFPSPFPFTQCIRPEKQR